MWCLHAVTIQTLKEREKGGSVCSRLTKQVSDGCVDVSQLLG